MVDRWWERPFGVFQTNIREIDAGSTSMACRRRGMNLAAQRRRHRLVLPVETAVSAPEPVAAQRRAGTRSAMPSRRPTSATCG
jgi:hypothetical protein